MTAALIGAMVVPTMMAFTLGVIAPHLTSDAGLTVAEVGLLTSALYLVTAALSQAGGHFTDARGFATACTSAVVLAALGFFALARSRGLLPMSLAMAFSGLANALSNPATNRAVTDAVPRRLHARAMGWKQAGVPLSGLACGAVIPAIARAFGWRAAMVAVGCAVLVIGAVSVAVLARASDRLGQTSAEALPCRAVQLRGLNAVALWMGAVTGAMQAYLVLHGVEVLGYTPSVAAALMSVVGAAGAAGRVVWASRISRGLTSRQAIRVVPAVSILAIGLVASSVECRWLVWPGAVLTGAAIFGFSTVGMLAIVLEVPGRAVGTATGLFSRAFFVGILLGSMAPGLVVDASGSFTLAWLLVLVEALAAMAVTRRSGFMTAG